MSSRSLLRRGACIVIAAVSLSALVPPSARGHEGTDVKAVIAEFKKEATAIPSTAGAPVGILVRRRTKPRPDVTPCPNGVRLAAIERSTKEIGSYPCEAIPPLQEPPPAQGLLQCPGRAKGPLYGPFLPLVLNNARYTEASAYPPLLQQLPPDVGAPLLRDWAAIDAEKTDLESVARPLDADDDKVSVELDRLNAWDSRIKRRGELIDEEAARYAAACLGRPLPPDQLQYCRGWQQRLNQCIDAHNAEADRSDAYYAGWLTRRDTVKSRGDAFKVKVNAWVDAKIVPFIAAATKATDDAGRTTVRIQAQGDDIPDRGGYSVSIDQLRPICLGDGLRGLASVQARLNNRQFAARDQALLKAERFMRNAAANGGVGPSENNFKNVPADPPNARIDVTVFRGLAFVDCSAASRSARP